MKKNTNTFYVFVAALITALLSITACQNVFNQPETGTHTGRLALSINNANGRTILPPAGTSFTKYTLDFYLGDSTTPVKSVNWTTSSDIIVLSPGTYRLEVIGFIGETASAFGTVNNIVISTGGTVTKRVILDPYTDGTVQGTFSWDLEAFTDAQAITIVIDEYNDETPGNEITVSNANAVAMQELDAGIYSVIFTVVNNDDSIITWRTILYIYPGLTSGCIFNPDDDFTFSGDNGEIGDLFTISGRLADSSNEVDAKFYASVVADDPAPMGRSARTLMPLAESDEVPLEGLLEDGSVIFNLKGSYNKQTRDYILSAAASFMRYSISGNLETGEAVAIVQIKFMNNWLSFTVSEVEVESNETAETAPEIVVGDDNVVEDTLNDGIPKEMWGVWWGLETLQKDNLFQPGEYYYVLDAYTIKQYVNRYGLWNLESYTCFFEGATIEVIGGMDTAKGRVEFNYTDQEKIDNDPSDEIKNWWINHLIAYAAEKWNTVPGGLSTDSATIAKVKDIANQGWNLWSDPSWTEVLNRYKAPAQGDEGPLGTGSVWNNHFGPGTGFSYTAYRNDAYRINNGYLQFGRYYASNGKDYFDKDPDKITGFDKLVWGASHSRDQNAAAVAPPSSQVVTGSWSGLTIPGQVMAVKHGIFEEEANVLQVISGAHWSVLYYDLSSYYAKGVKFTEISMDVWLEKDALVAWQLGNEAGKYPLLAGKWDALEAGQWHTVTMTELAEDSYGIVRSDASLYLSTMQILRDGTAEGTTYTENTIYIANVVITAEVDNEVIVDALNNIDSNMGTSEYGYISGSERERKQARWYLEDEKLNLVKNAGILEIKLSGEYSPFITLAWQDTTNYSWNPYEIIGTDLNDGVTWNATAKILYIDLGKAIVNRSEFMAQPNLVFIIQCYYFDRINELGIISANVKESPLYITGNLGNYSYGTGEYDRAVWGLTGKNLRIAQADDAKLVLEFSKTLSSNISLVWQAAVDGWSWNSTPIYTSGSPVSGVTYNSNTLTVNLPQVLAKYSDFKTVTDYSNFIIVSYGIENINQLGMTSANLTGTVSNVSGITVKTVFDQDSKLSVMATVNGNTLNVVFTDSNNYGVVQPQRSIQWYLNGNLATGIQDGENGLNIPLPTLDPGTYSGTAVVTIGGTVLSQKFNFTVE